MNKYIKGNILEPIDRLRIYKKMLRSYKWSLYTPKFFHNTQYGICYWLWKYVPIGSPLVHLYNYPELRNTDMSFGLGYWWEPGDLEPRILAIQNAISDVEKVI